jgi:hypothetical protein
MVPLINGAGRRLRWFIEDVCGQFGDDHTRPGAPLFLTERVKANADARQLGPDTLRAALSEATPGCVDHHIPIVGPGVQFPQEATHPVGYPPGRQPWLTLTSYMMSLPSSNA